jgi:hypothetical protein
MRITSDLVSAFDEIDELERSESRKAWRSWCGAFCRGGPGRWDTIGLGGERYGESALEAYEKSSAGELVFGAPDLGGLWKGRCAAIPPYEAWLALFEEEGDDALYIWSSDHSWTLAIHHEQFGGMVAGPIWSGPL